MTRFVDLTDFYWSFTRAEVAEDPTLSDVAPKPCCAFLSTCTDRFIEGKFGAQIFNSLEEVREELGDEFVERVPEGFFL